MEEKESEGEETSEQEPKGGKGESASMHSSTEGQTLTREQVGLDGLWCIKISLQEKVSKGEQNHYFVILAFCF